MHGLLEGRERSEESLRKAAKALTLARALEGEETLASLALAGAREIPVEIERQKVWGIPTPEVSGPRLLRASRCARSVPLGLQPRRRGGRPRPRGGARDPAQHLLAGDPPAAARRGDPEDVPPDQRPGAVPDPAPRRRGVADRAGPGGAGAGGPLPAQAFQGERRRRSVMTEPTAVHIRQVLFASDFSPHSDHAFDAALALARHFGARLHLLHVVHHTHGEQAARAHLEAFAGSGRRRWSGASPSRQACRLADREACRAGEGRPDRDGDPRQDGARPCRLGAAWPRR